MTTVISGIDTGFLAFVARNYLLVTTVTRVLQDDVMPALCVSGVVDAAAKHVAVMENDPA